MFDDEKIVTQKKKMQRQLLSHASSLAVAVLSGSPVASETWQPELCGLVDDPKSDECPPHPQKITHMAAVPSAVPKLALTGAAATWLTMFARSGEGDAMRDTAYHFTGVSLSHALRSNLEYVGGCPSRVGTAATSAMMALTAFRLYERQHSWRHRARRSLSAAKVVDLFGSFAMAQSLFYIGSDVLDSLEVCEVFGASNASVAANASLGALVEAEATSTGLPDAVVWIAFQLPVFFASLVAAIVYYDWGLPLFAGMCSVVTDHGRAELSVLGGIVYACPTLYALLKDFTGR